MAVRAGGAGRERVRARGRRGVLGGGRGARHLRRAGGGGGRRAAGHERVRRRRREPAAEGGGARRADADRQDGHPRPAARHAAGQRARPLHVGRRRHVGRDRRRLPARRGEGGRGGRHRDDGRPPRRAERRPVRRLLRQPDAAAARRRQPVAGRLLGGPLQVPPARPLAALQGNVQRAREPAERVESRPAGAARHRGGRCRPARRREGAQDGVPEQREALLELRQQADQVARAVQRHQTADGARRRPLRGEHHGRGGGETDGQQLPVGAEQLQEPLLRTGKGSPAPAQSPASRRNRGEVV